MKKIVKALSILMIFAIIPVLTACDNSKSKSNKNTPAKLDNINIEKVAEAYLNAYLGREVNYDETGLKKDDLQDYVYKRDYNIVNKYSAQDGKDEEILKAYYEGLKNVEFSIKSSDVREVTVAIKGINISEVENIVQTHMMKVKREKEITIEGLRSEGENKAIEALKAAPVLEEKEITLNFAKDSEDKLRVADVSIQGIENGLSYVEDNYKRFTGQVPEEFKKLEIK
ncbi:MAG: hypothetical protein E7213_11300 [Clostridium sp.]|nr:hypothetical protein [Clostridium sp.]